MRTEFIHYLSAHGLTAVLPLAVGFLVAIQRPRLFLFRSFLAYNLTIAWWAVFTLLMQFSPGSGLALFWDRVSLIGIAFIPSTFLHFTLVFLRKNKTYQSLVQIVYVLSTVFAFLSFTPLMLASVSAKHYVPYFTDPGPMYSVFLSFFGFTMVLALFFSYQAYLERRLTRQARPTFYFFLAALVAIVGGSGNFLVPYDVFVPFVIPYGTYGVVIYAVVTGYLIVIHRLLGIEVIVKKTLVFAGLFAMVMAVVGSITTVSQVLVSRYWDMPTALSMGLSVFVAILLYEPTKNLLIHLTDRFLFQKREPVKEILRRLSGRIITILDLPQVAKTILDTFNESLRAETGAIFLANESGYKLLRSYGLSVQGGISDLDAEEPLAKRLLADRQLINLEDEQTKARLPVPASARLEHLKAVIALPLFLHDKLIGLVTLGKKKSDQEYTAEEIDYFPTVASQVAIALSNARLYHESIEARKKIEEMQLELIHRQKMAFVADLVKGIAHEVFNPLTPVFHAVEALETSVFVKLVNVLKTQEGKMDQAAVDEYFKALEELREVLRGLKVNTQHIYHVIDTLNKMQKEDKETIGPVDLKTFLKDSTALIGMELHGETREIPMIEEVPRGLPPLKGNPTLLTQVFVNLFKNSVYAMDGKAEKKITIRAVLDPEDPRFLKIDFSDTGSGIPADVLPKVFDFGFTTKRGEGQGIGLNQCRLIIEKFGGSLSCSSPVGEGTTFTLKLPVWEGGKIEDLGR